MGTVVKISKHSKPQDARKALDKLFEKSQKKTPQNIGRLLW
jgi:hypothetical protein